GPEVACGTRRIHRRHSIKIPIDKSKLYIRCERQGNRCNLCFCVRIQGQRTSSVFRICRNSPAYRHRLQVCPGEFKSRLGVNIVQGNGNSSHIGVSSDDVSSLNSGITEPSGNSSTNRHSRSITNLPKLLYTVEIS